MQPIHLKRAVLSIAIACLLGATPVLAAPGDPLGGDDTGCTASTKLGLLCAKKVLGLLVKLQISVVKCHITQAGQAFQTGHSSNGFSNAEENCSVGPSNTSAKAKFDDKIASLAANGCDATVIANANAARDVILGDQTVSKCVGGANATNSCAAASECPGGVCTSSLDRLNGTFFCDSTSGNTIDVAGGDDAGFIPSTPENFKCSVGVAKAWAKLVKGAYTCHSKLAASVFKSVAFDEDFCEDNSGGLGKSKLEKYNLLINKFITAGICPSCLTDPGPTNALDLGASTIADSDTGLQDVYICPGP